jgi:uncharacterized protein YihD (DUF1040 family)
MKLIIATITLVALAGCTSEQQSRDKERVAYCWTQQSLKSNTPAKARMIAGICEDYEADYVTAYNSKP